MQELIQTHHLTFTYPDSPQPALADINLTIFAVNLSSSPVQPAVARPL